MDDARTRYTGILCGLGVDSDGKPMFPEHDMEIAFDVEFSVQDLEKVSGLKNLATSKKRVLLVRCGDITIKNNKLNFFVSFQINFIRHLMSFLLFTEKDSKFPDLSEKDVMQGQTKIKNLIMEYVFYCLGVLLFH